MSNAEQSAPVDVATILQALRSEIRAQHALRSSAATSELERDLRRHLDELELTRVVSAVWPLESTSFPQRVINLVNKIVRRALRWYINPIVEQQNAFNDTAARTLRLLADAYSQLAATQEAPPTSHDAGDTHAQPQPAAASTDAHPTDATYAQYCAMVQQQAAAEPPATFPELPVQLVQPQLQLRRVVSAHWELRAQTFTEHVAALVHKLTRRYLRWLINPIVEQQNAANESLVNTVGALIRLDAERRAEVAAAQARAARDTATVPTRTG